MKINASKLAVMALLLVPNACVSGSGPDVATDGKTTQQSKTYSGPDGELYPTEEQKNAALAVSSEDPLPSMEISVPPATRLAAVRLSHTHAVEFYELEPGVTFAAERLHVDHDLEGQPLLFGPDDRETRHRPLLEMYRELVGDAIDPSIADVLEAADRRGAAGGAPAGAHTVAREQDLSARYASAGGFVEKSHAGCPAPSGWDWNSDSIWWFETHGCYNPFTCTNNCWRYNCMATSPAQFLEDPGNGGWREAQVYITSGFAQQFCNKVRFTMWRQEGSNTLVHYKVFEETLQPRHFITTSLGTDRYPMLRMSSVVQKVSGSQPDKKGIAVRWWHPDFWD